MLYVIEQTTKDGKTHYTGMYRAKGGRRLSAGTYDTHERTYEVTEQE